MPAALLSVFDKTGIIDLAEALAAAGWDIISSGGTAKVLNDAGLAVTDVADLTGYPAMLGHRVVTLHPTVHAGILADLDEASHVADLEAHDISPISLVVVNLYPFDSNPSIELIDIGGPTLVRGAAKNHAHVAVVVRPDRHDRPVGRVCRRPAHLVRGAVDRPAQALQLGDRDRVATAFDSDAGSACVRQLEERPVK